jgi:tRNA 2-thiouridine synthesizing protein C
VSQPLFIFTQAPYNSAQAREGIEALLACAAFDQQPNVLFMDQAVFQLVSLADRPGEKNLNKMVQAFELYGVQALFVCAESLLRFGCDSSASSPHVTLINQQQRCALIEDANWVARF